MKNMMKLSTGNLLLSALILCGLNSTAFAAVMPEDLGMQHDALLGKEHKKGGKGHKKDKKGAQHKKNKSGKKHEALGKELHPMHEHAMGAMHHKSKGKVGKESRLRNRKPGKAGKLSKREKRHSGPSKRAMKKAQFKVERERQLSGGRASTKAKAAKMEKRGHKKDDKKN